MSFKNGTAAGPLESSGEKFSVTVKRLAGNSEIIFGLVIGNSALEGANTQSSSGNQSFILWQIALA